MSQHWDDAPVCGWCAGQKVKPSAMLSNCCLANWVCWCFPGTRSEGWRAAEYPQLPPDHARGRHAHADATSLQARLATRWRHNTTVLSYALWRADVRTKSASCRLKQSILFGIFSPLIWRGFRNVCLKLQNITMYSNDAVLRPLTFFVMSGFAPKIVICVKFTLISLLCYFSQKSKCPLNSFHLHLFFLSGWQPIGCPAVVGGSDVWTSRFYGSGLWPAQRHPVTATLSLKRVVNSADLIRVQAQEINLIFCSLWWDN